MDNVDIFIFTFLVVPAFLFFVVATIREFAKAGKSDLDPEADKIVR